MKIGTFETKPPSTQPAERKTAAASSTKGAEPSAQVALSTAATALSSPASDPTFDTAKVERIAQAIRDGKFKVNADAIADKLIINAQELLGGRKAN